MTFWDQVETPDMATIKYERLTITILQLPTPMETMTELRKESYEKNLINNMIFKLTCFECLLTKYKKFKAKTV